MRSVLSVRRLGRVMIFAALGLLLLQAGLALFGMPQSVIKWLDANDLKPRETPRYIVVLGGGGMPSQSTLIRLYQAAHFGQGLTNTTFIVSLPAAQDPEHAGVGRMRDDLVMRGIPASAIQMETKGKNTREEAVNVRNILGDKATQENVLIVSSDFHLRRAVLLFRKVGFAKVSALSAHTVDAEADPGVLAWLRYGIWNNMETAVKASRELIALAACKVSGWI